MVGNLVAALLLATVMMPVQPLPDRGEPIADEAYVDDLLGADFENGRLPADALLLIESSDDCLLEEEAAEAWQRLEIHAANAGIELVARWCYRNLATQKRTYRRNCPRTIVGIDPPQPPGAGEDPPAHGDEAVAVSPKTKKGPRVCSPPTAKPGNSNHGWGRAADIKTEGRLLTCESEGFLWLQDNAHLYGWVHPAWAACGEPKEEAWHWEWGGTQKPAPQVTRTRTFTA